MPYEIYLHIGFGFPHLVSINENGDTFGTTVNSANIISFLLVLFIILKVESGAIRRKGLKSTYTPNPK